MPHNINFAIVLFTVALCFGSEKPARVLLAESGRTAASSALARPVLGFAFDENSSGLRAITGVPGAALLGRPVAACGQRLRNVAVSPAGDYLLATVGDDNRVILCRNLADNASASLLASAPAGPGTILLSPGGSAAAFFYTDAQEAVLVKGLPDAPAAARIAGISGLLAVSDSGALLAASPQGGGEMLSLVTAESRTPLGTVGHAAAAAFLSGRDEAVIADETHDAAYLAGANGIQTLAAARDGIGSPSAVAVSSDNRDAFVANTNGEIARVRLSGGPPAVVSCGCRIAALERLGGNSVFRIRSSADAPVLVYDGDAQTARVVVIPPETDSGRSADRNPGNGRAR